MESILGPTAEVDIIGGIEEDALTLSFFIDDLSNVLTIIRVWDLNMII